MSASARRGDSRRPAMAALALALSVPFAMPAQAQPALDALRQRDQELEAVRAEQRRAAQTEAKLKLEIQTIGDDRRKLNQALIDTAARLRTAEERIAATEARLKPLDESERRIRGSLEERRETIAEVLAALQRMGRRPPPALMVRPQDALAAVRSAIMLGAVVPGMRVQAEALAADLADLTRVRKDIDEEKARLGRDRTALAEERQRVTALGEERRRKQAEVERTLDAERAKQPADGRMDLAALKDPGRLSPAVAFASTRGHLPLPVNGVRIREFGAPDSLGGTERGLTIATRAGAQVTSPCDGWVVYSGPFRNYGQVLILNAGGGYHVVLAGMERSSVDVGQFVLTGEPVAIMGTGSQVAATLATGTNQPILYVEFRKDGSPVDPAPWWAASEGEKARG